MEGPPPSAAPEASAFPSRAERARAGGERRWRRRPDGDRPRGEIHDRLKRARERRAAAEQAYVDYWREVTGWRRVRVTWALVLAATPLALILLSWTLSGRVALGVVTVAYLVPPLIWRANRTVEGLALWLWRVQREREVAHPMARLVGRGMLRSETTPVDGEDSPGAVVRAPQRALFHSYVEALERAIAGTPTGREGLEPEVAALADPLLRRYWTVQLAVLDGIAARATGGDARGPLVALAVSEAFEIPLRDRLLGPWLTRWGPAVMWLVVAAAVLIVGR